jgi:hypothetical protein
MLLVFILIIIPIIIIKTVRIHYHTIIIISCLFICYWIIDVDCYNRVNIAEWMYLWRIGIRVNEDLLINYWGGEFVDIFFMLYI